LLTRFLREFLDQVNPHDPAAFMGVPILLLGVTLAACWIPARRASRVDPAITLRWNRVRYHRLVGSTSAFRT
jgi:hypothetical protein